LKALRTIKRKKENGRELQPTNESSQKQEADAVIISLSVIKAFNLERTLISFSYTNRYSFINMLSIFFSKSNLGWPNMTAFDEFIGKVDVLSPQWPKLRECYL
jgi:hypothetical protein